MLETNLICINEKPNDVDHSSISMSSSSSGSTVSESLAYGRLLWFLRLFLVCVCVWGGWGEGILDRSQGV